MYASNEQLYRCTHQRKHNFDAFDTMLMQRKQDKKIVLGPRSHSAEALTKHFLSNFPFLLLLSPLLLLMRSLYPDGENDYYQST